MALPSLRRSGGYDSPMLTESQAPKTVPDLTMAEPTDFTSIDHPFHQPYRPASTTGEGPSAFTKASPIRNKTKRKATVHFDEADTLSNSPAAKKAKATPNRTTQTPRRKTPRSNRALPIARSYEECEPHDKSLVDMRDAGRPWPDIQKEWARLTGEKNTGKSTLPNRYIRLKENFTRIKDEDKALLIVAKQEIEDEFAEEKWERVAAKMTEKGTQTYQPEVLYIQWKKMMLSAEYLPAARDNAHKKNKWQGRIDEVIEGGG